MATVTSSYTAKKAAALTNPITNDSIFVQSDNSAKSAFVSLYQLVQSSATVQPLCLEFYVRATGIVTTGTTSTLLVGLYYSTGASGSTTRNGTGVSSLQVPAFTSGSIATASQNWDVEANLFWDATSKVMNGYYWTINPASGTTCQITAQTAITSLTAIDLTALSVNAPIGAPGLTVGAHFGSTNASNVVTMTEFVAEVL